MLRLAILDGRLTPGEHIRQAAIAAQYGVSRIPVREALLQLQAEGLITITPNAGARVARLDPRELDVVYWLRERLEPATIAEGIPHLTDARLGSLRRYVEEMEAATVGRTDIWRWLQCDRRFHLEALAAAPLPQVLRLIEGIWNQSEPYRRAYAGTHWPHGMDITHAEHRLLLDAFQRGDAHDGTRLLEIHIRRTRIGLQAHPEVFSSIPTPAGEAAR